MGSSKKRSLAGMIISSEEQGERRRVVEKALDEIIDPCSAAAGTPIGIADMGIVDRIDVADSGHVVIRLLPTFPGCRFVAIFESVIQERLGTLAWCTGVDVEFAGPDEVWDESRLSIRAMEQLEGQRRAMRSLVSLPVRPAEKSHARTAGAS